MIIPDVHELWQRAKDLRNASMSFVDRRVWLGDFYDKFGPFIQDDAIQTAKLHREIIESRNDTALMGNHDIQYCWPENQALKCSGYNPFKVPAIKHIMTREHWNKVVYHTWVNDGKKEWLLSHAGVHPYNMDYALVKDYPTILKAKEAECQDRLFSGQNSAFVSAGQARGGFSKYGGINWLDWNREFTPIPGLNQIVGHTVDHTWRIKPKSQKETINYCIDDALKSVIIIDDIDHTVKVCSINEILNIKEEVL